MDQRDLEHLINECKRIEGDSLYTGEAHYLIASAAGKLSFWVKAMPALASAVSGSVLLKGAPVWVAWFAVISGVVFALQAIINPDRKKAEHSRAGKMYTALKHEARSLYQTFYKEMDYDMFSTEVKILAEKYRVTNNLTPQTTNRAFEKGRKRIKNSRHTPDFEENK